MTKGIFTGGLAALIVALVGSGPVLAGEPSLIPWPVKVAPGAGRFVVSGKTPICATGAAGDVAGQLKTVAKAVQGLDLASGCGKGAIELILTPDAAISDPEGYTLDVGAKGVRITAREAGGLYYGAMTLAQLMSSDSRFGAPVTLSGVHIIDYPRFKWRGLMIDSARHFLPVADIKRMIDQMGEHKLNVLHWHLTDDQGWRLEIKRYPDLTKVGGWRTPPSNGGPGSETEPYGGFYTQDEGRDLVAYAAARHITIVPELDMPGHAQSAVAGHPALSVTGEQPQVSPDWGVNPYLYNTDADSIAFVENVLDEVMALFPSTYIHLGGDEAVKDQWKNSPKIQAQMKALGITSEDAMQSWFMEQLGSYLAAHGRKMMGWDEILEGGIPPSAAVMSWRGDDGAIQGAQLGHDVVIATLYLDNLQTRRNDEPAGRMGILPLAKVYAFEAMPTVLSLEESKHVLGGQANLWSEYLITPWYVQNAAFPRVDAASEAFWTQPARRNWSGFLARLPVQLERYRRQGVHYSDNAFAVDFQLTGDRNAVLAAGGGELALINQTRFGQIRYTLDGSEPGLKSALYTAPLKLDFGHTVKAATFDDAGRVLAATRTYDFSANTLLTRPSNELKTCAGGDFGQRAPLTADSPDTRTIYDIDIFHDCYVYPQAKLDKVAAIDLNIARLARNYALSHDQDQVKSYPKQTPFGELVVLQDGCQGTELARQPLPDPKTSNNQQAVTLKLPAASGVHDLCLMFTAPIDGPFYAIDTAKLDLQD